MADGAVVSRRAARSSTDGMMADSAVVSSVVSTALNRRSIPLAPRRERLLTAGVAIGAIALFVAAVTFLNLDLSTFAARMANFPNVARRFVAFDPGMLATGLEQLAISFGLGVAGLVLGGAVAFVLAFLAADNTAPIPALAHVIKGGVSIIRAIPSLILILMIVASIGIGPTSGVVGLMLSSIGYLTKAFISTIEEQNPATMEALKATGASWLQIMIEGILPAVLTGFTAWIAIRLESSVSESISLGVIGAGGIGQLLGRALRQHNHSGITTLVLIIFVAMFALELIMKRFKEKLR